jgi:hypothetical protein
MRDKPDPDDAAPVRTLACAKCGHQFTADAGVEALAQKRLRQAHRTEDPDATHQVFVEKAGELAKAWDL